MVYRTIHEDNEIGWTLRPLGCLILLSASAEICEAAKLDMLAGLDPSHASRYPTLWTSSKGTAFGLSQTHMALLGVGGRDKAYNSKTESDDAE